MPTRAARPCRQPGCSVLVRGRIGFCTAHLSQRRSEFDATRGSAASRGYGPEWREIRARFLNAHPLCACGAKATEPDHVIPLAEGGTNDWSNLTARCKTHHSQRTAREQGFGKTRARKQASARVQTSAGQRHPRNAA